MGILHLSIFVTFLSVVASEYVYEFGTNEGRVIYAKDGNIGFFQPSTVTEIPVPPGMMVAYVKVTVDSISAPKVEYNSDFHTLSINFSWTQISSSTYKIKVKGIKYDNSDDAIKFINS